MSIAYKLTARNITSRLVSLDKDKEASLRCDEGFSSVIVSLRLDAFVNEDPILCRGAIACSSCKADPAPERGLQPLV